MSLEVQFQSLIASFLYGLFLGFAYGLFNRICFHMRFLPLRWAVEIAFDTCLLLGYFFFIVSLNHGNFNVYLILALGFGVLFYLFCFAGGYLFYLEYLMRFFRWLFFRFTSFSLKYVLYLDT